MLEALAELRERPSRLGVLFVCAAVVVAHQATRWTWYIDDAGICFAYARNLVHGEGLVPWPGGERIEAISDPTWVLLLALFQAVGLDGFTVAKPLGMAFGVLTLGITWRLARLAMPEHRGEGALLAPILLAVNAQFAIWSASGLENGLFCFLLALALYRTLVETRDGGFPWGSVVYLAIGWTRPEGVLYAAIGGLWFLAWTVRDGRPLRVVAQWLAAYWVPTLLLEAARIWYFAWPLPNTFYAKVENRGVAPLEWDSRGWRQVREWAGRLWHGYQVPLYVVGLTGVHGHRVRVGLGAVVVLGLALLWPGPDKLQEFALWPKLPDPPSAFVLARLLAIGVSGALLPLLALGRPGGRALVLAGHTMFVGLGFSVLSNGDWMGAYRWMSLVSVPGSVLLAAGLVEALDALSRRTGGSTAAWSSPTWLAASLLVGLQLPPNLSQTRDHSFFNINETIESTVTRVNYTRSVLRTTFWEEPVVNLEVDQGAHLWFAPDYAEVDMAFLVDVPMARHWYQQRAFIREYVFEERKPTFAHVGGWWAAHTGLRRYPEWEPTFFELPPYTDPRWNGPFPNVFARREMVVAPSWDGTPGRSAPLGKIGTLEGWEVPAPWTPGRDGYLEVPISLSAPWLAHEPLALRLFVTRGESRHRWDLPLGYGFYPPHWWAPGQVFRGRYAVPVPKDAAPGRWDLVVELVGAEDRILGRHRIADAVEVVAAGEHDAAIDATRARAASLAAEGACEQAEIAWVLLKRHRPRAWGWHESERPASTLRIADCWARVAEASPARAPELLARAHRWNHWSPELRRVGGPVGVRLYAEGRAAREAADWQAAYDAFSALLAFQPWRSWARRWAEEARDHRLGLTGDMRIGIGGEDDLRAWESQQ